MRRPRLVLALTALAVIDLAGGVLLLVWPGLWQELLHPAAMGTVFYPLQRTGAAWLARGVVAAVAARRRSARWVGGLALLWAVEAPGALLLAWRTADTGPHTAWAYSALAAWALLIAFALWRNAHELEADEEPS